MADGRRVYEIAAETARAKGESRLACSRYRHCERRGEKKSAHLKVPFSSRPAISAWPQRRSHLSMPGRFHEGHSTCQYLQAF
jgi:hypothetical protein